MFRDTASPISWSATHPLVWGNWLDVRSCHLQSVLDEQLHPSRSVSKCQARAGLGFRVPLKVTRQVPLIEALNGGTLLQLAVHTNCSWPLPTLPLRVVLAPGTTADPPP